MDPGDIRPGASYQRGGEVWKVLELQERGNHSWVRYRKENGGGLVRLSAFAAWAEVEWPPLVRITGVDEDRVTVAGFTTGVEDGTYQRVKGDLFRREA